MLKELTRLAYRVLLVLFVAGILYFILPDKEDKDLSAGYKSRADSAIIKNDSSK